MDLMEKIKEFLNSDENKFLFTTNGYNITIINGELHLQDKNNKKIEVMKRMKDENNKKRIRFKGTNFAFSINIDDNENLHLDHLLIGNIKQDEYDFIMRKEVIDGKIKIIVKLVDDKNVKHIYKINEDSINIDRIAIRKKDYLDKSIEEKNLKNNRLEEYKINHFHLFKGSEDQVIIGEEQKDYLNNCLKEFLILEKSFVSITSYIERRIPFIKSCIQKVSNPNIPITESTHSNVKEYEIKRKTNIPKPYEPIYKGKTKIYQFSRDKKN